MKNLDQIRAAAGLRDAEKTTRQAVSKLPAMILSNGLLAAAAFATETKENGQPKRPEMKSAMDGAAQHLAHAQHGIAVLAGKSTAKQMVEALTAADASSSDLQRATAEALAYLAYLKRFATKQGDGE